MQIHLNVYRSMPSLPKVHRPDHLVRSTCEGPNTFRPAHDPPPGGDDLGDTDSNEGRTLVDIAKGKGVSSILGAVALLVVDPFPATLESLKWLRVSARFLLLLMVMMELPGM